MFAAAGSIIQLHAVEMQLNFKYESLHMGISPPADRHKLHAARIRARWHERKSHFDFECNISVASKQLVFACAWVKSVSNANDFHDKLTLARAR